MEVMVKWHDCVFGGRLGHVVHINKVQCFNFTLLFGVAVNVYMNLIIPTDGQGFNPCIVLF